MAEKGVVIVIDDIRMNNCLRKICSAYSFFHCYNITLKGRQNLFLDNKSLFLLFGRCYLKTHTLLLALYSYLKMQSRIHKEERTCGVCGFGSGLSQTV